METNGTSGYCETILPLRSALLGAALAMTRNEAEASDLVQDTLERTLRTFNHFEPGSDARAWSMTILTRLFIDRCRKRSRRQRLLQTLRLDPTANDDDTTAPDEPREWQRLTADDLRRAAADLPPHFRRVFELCAFGGLSHAEIGEVTGLPVRTVGTRMLRARRRIREMLLADASGDNASGARRRRRARPDTERVAARAAATGAAAAAAAAASLGRPGAYAWPMPGNDGLPLAARVYDAPVAAAAAG